MRCPHPAPSPKREEQKLVAGCSFCKVLFVSISRGRRRSSKNWRSIMQCLQAPAAAACSDLSVLERQIARLNWQQQQQMANSYNAQISGCYGLEGLIPISTPAFQMVHAAHGEQSDGVVVGNVHGPSIVGLPDLAGAQYNPVVGAAAAKIGQEDARDVEESLSSCSSKKRKADTSSPKPLKQQENSSNDSENMSKRIKEEIGRVPESRQTPSDKNDASGNASKDNSKPQKTDYIHVRARRGQATDSHSLAERVRRERISERMKYLQELVPGCNKITGKAGMLDEIINYVQSLQRQVEFLSMKLAAVNPAMDFTAENFFGRQMNPVCNSNSIPIMSTATEQLESPYLQFNPMQQANACDMPMNVSELGLRRTVSAPVGVFADALLGSWFNVHGSSAWDSSLHNIYNVEFQQGRGSSFPVQSLPGNELPQNMKMEM